MALVSTLPRCLGRRSFVALSRGPGVPLLLVWCSCSFGAAAINGKSSVREGHEIADALIGTVAAGGCVLAAVAWQHPDSYAPTQDDPSSWSSPQDRSNTISTGKDWTPWACTAAVIFLASGIYGHNVKHTDDDAKGPRMDNVIDHVGIGRG